ncbi:hypothetical protein BDV96DRAFT_655071 [Lophiotrema nucula]|uniref:Uncharacterized protein n=1 Tax=Lophiotrema nucula TaxID=690887 RepID=A0A6A5YIV6_9PLEO|nr:hypothetical protein BDV96DRAFT_655071 [Lophiotrema nucula]
MSLKYLRLPSRTSPSYLLSLFILHDHGNSQHIRIYAHVKHHTDKPKEDSNWKSTASSILWKHNSKGFHYFRRVDSRWMLTESGVEIAEIAEALESVSENLAASDGSMASAASEPHISPMIIYPESDYQAAYRFSHTNDGQNVEFFDLTSLDADYQAAYRFSHTNDGQNVGFFDLTSLDADYQAAYHFPHTNDGQNVGFFDLTSLDADYQAAYHFPHTNNGQNVGFFEPTSLDTDYQAANPFPRTNDSPNVDFLDLTSVDADYQAATPFPRTNDSQNVETPDFTSPSFEPRSNTSNTSNSPAHHGQTFVDTVGSSSNSCHLSTVPAEPAIERDYDYMQPLILPDDHPYWGCLAQYGLFPPNRRR